MATWNNYEPQSVSSIDQVGVPSLDLPYKWCWGVISSFVGSIYCDLA
jgi:hypothetical protein